MNNGYQKYNGCGADKEGGKIFNTFFYPNAQSKYVSPLAYNVSRLCEGCEALALSGRAACTKPLLAAVFFSLIFSELKNN